MLNVGNLGPNVTNEHIIQKLAWQMINLPAETQNAFANWYLAYASEHPEAVEGMVELIRASPGRLRCLSQMPKGKGPILIVGSGGSVDSMMPTIKDWKPPIICSTSQASTLIYYGRHPEYVCCLDPRVAPADELAAPDWGDTMMIGHVSIPNEYIVRWLRRARGPLYIGRIMEPTYDWYSHHLGQGYPWIRHIILPMIDSLAGEISFATWLGYKPIYLAGCDYGGPRFDRYDWRYDTQSWKLDAGSSKVDMGTPLGIRMMSYSSRGTLLSAFMQMANPKYRQEVYQLSDRSVLTQFPHRKWEEVLSAQGDSSRLLQLYPPRQNILDEIEIALAIWDTFLVPVQGGWGVDWQTYIAMDEGSFAAAMNGYNNQVANNKKDFANIEAHHKKPVQEMIAQGKISIEAGDLLLHGAEEFQDWDWHKMEPINIGDILVRRKWLLAEAHARGYNKDRKDVEAITDKINQAFLGEPLGSVTKEGD